MTLPLEIIVFRWWCRRFDDSAGVFTQGRSLEKAPAEIVPIAEFLEELWSGQLLR